MIPDIHLLKEERAVLGRVIGVGLDTPISYKYLSLAGEARRLFMRIWYNQYCASGSSGRSIILYSYDQSVHNIKNRPS